MGLVSTPLPPVPSRLFAVALGVPTMRQAEAFLAEGCAGADIVEVRLDYFEEKYDTHRLVETSSRPLLFTLRPEREGGRSRQSDSERLMALRGLDRRFIHQRLPINVDGCSILSETSNHTLKVTNGCPPPPPKRFCRGCLKL